MVIFTTSAIALEKEESDPIGPIVETFRSGNAEEGKAQLQKLFPDGYKPIQDLIKRSLQQEEKVEKIARDLNVQQGFLSALNSRLEQETERMLKANKEK